MDGIITSQHNLILNASNRLGRLMWHLVSTLKQFSSLRVSKMNYFHNVFGRMFSEIFSKAKNNELKNFENKKKFFHFYFLFSKVKDVLFFLKL